MMGDRSEAGDAGWLRLLRRYGMEDEWMKKHGARRRRGEREEAKHKGREQKKQHDVVVLPADPDPLVLDSKLKQVSLVDSPSPWPPLEEAEDLSIYVRVLHSRETLWYSIWSDTPENKDLAPELTVNITHQQCSICTVIGSTIYVFGGAEHCGVWPELGLESDRALKSVYYMDTNRPHDGWKPGPSMILPRAWCYPVAIGNLIYVFHGHGFPQRKEFNAELYDPTGQTPQKILKRIPFRTYILTAHAVFDQGKKVLLYSDTHDAPICCYNVDDDTYTPFNVSLCGDDQGEVQEGFQDGDDEDDEYRFKYEDEYESEDEMKRMLKKMLKKKEKREKRNLCKTVDCNSLTSSDGIIYIAGLTFDSLIVAVDPTSDDFDPKRPKAKPVEGLKVFNWLPKPRLAAAIRTIYLVSTGRGKLALLWGIPRMNGVHVHCAKMNIFKKLDDKTSEVTFEAGSVTHSVYYAPGHTLIQCLPVKTNWESVQKKSVQEESVQEKSFREKKKKKKKKKKKNNKKNQNA